MKRTKLSVCKKKVRYASQEDADAAARRASIILRPYKCDRGDHYHLTRRTKGKWMPKIGVMNKG